MFGYVIVNERQLSEDEHRRMRAFYCGVCRALKKRYGLSGQMTLSFDMAFLAMLLSSLYEPETAETEGRCAVHPKEKHRFFSNEWIDYAADMDVALFYFKCLDSWQDEKSLPARSMERMLKKGYESVRERWPRPCETIRRETEEQARLEKTGCADLDALCAPTGEMLAEIFACRDDRWADALRRMAKALGAFIYLMDAYEDMDKDARSGAFNPLLARRDEPGFEDGVRDTLTMMAAECAAAFETLPLESDLGILRNTLYSGIWTKYEGIRQKKAKAGKEKLDDH